MHTLELVPNNNDIDADDFVNVIIFGTQVRVEVVGVERDVQQDERAEK